MSELRTSAEALLAGLTDEQRDAVTTAASPLCILAGAGSGKTRVLTRRIAWQSASGAIDPRRVLAVTFTRRAAGELRRRLRGLGLADEVAAGTFHAVALAMLRRYWSENRIKPPAILQSRRALLRDLQSRWDTQTLSAVDNEIGWARARMVTPDGYLEAAAAARRRVPSLKTAAVADAYRAYGAAKQRRRLVDFDDILALAHQTLSRDTQFAAAQHWRQRHLLIDEFQDVNPLQFEVLKAWLGDESTLVVVGDPKQAIYAWNGAEPDLLAHIDRHLPGVAVTSLSVNFRSTPEILAAAALLAGSDAQPAAQPRGDDPTLRELLGPAPRGGPVAQPTAADSGRGRAQRAPQYLAPGTVVPQSAAHARTVRARGKGRTERAPRVRTAGDLDVTVQEAAGIARAVRGAHRSGAPWAHQAVLARTNEQLPPIQEALSRAGIPVRSRNTRGLLRFPEVEDWLAAYDRSGPVSLLVADLAAEVSIAGPGSFAASATRGRSEASFGSVVLARSEASGATANRQANRGFAGTAADSSGLLAQLVELARDALALDPALSIADFSESLRSDDGPSPPADGVDLSTFHQAKGLEWPIVHLIGVEDGYVPHYRSKTRSALAEERRLLYVAATRAERELHISWCRSRRIGDKIVDRRPSPWIEALVERFGGVADGDSEAAVAAAALAKLRAARYAADSAGSAGSGGPSASPADPADAGDSADAVEFADSADPVESAESADAGDSADPAESADAGDSADPSAFPDEPAFSDAEPDRGLRPASSTRSLAGTGRRPAFDPTDSAAESAGFDPDALRQRVLDALLAWRDRAARNALVEPSAVLTDETLARLAELRPACLEDLAAVEGMGAPQARRFGPRILEITNPS